MEGNMKRNKLILASGILMVILASLSIIATIATIETLLTGVALLDATEYLAEYSESDIMLGLVMLVYTLQIGIYLAQSIVYMIFGIKFIKKSKLPNAYAKCRASLIVMLVLVCCSLLAESNVAFSGVTIATVVLIICAIANGNRLDNENLQYLQNQMNGVNAQPSQSINVNVQSTSVGTPSAHEFTEPSTNNVENLDKKNIQLNTNEKSNSDLMAEKILSLKNLKDNGVISAQEFDNIMATLVPNKVDNKDKVTKADSKDKANKVDSKDKINKVANRDKATKADSKSKVKVEENTNEDILAKIRKAKMSVPKSKTSTPKATKTTSSKSTINKENKE